MLFRSSNIGSRQLKDFGQGVGFGTQAKLNSKNEYSQSVIENALKRTFAPEFLNRVDDVVMFNSLEKKDIHKIIGIEIRHVVKRVEEMGYKIELTEKALDFIAEKGWDEQYGARPLKRAVQKYVEDVLADAIISSNLHIGDLISIDLAENGEETAVNIVPKNERILEEAVV
ncbi:MAG: ATP-dependent Clp protease ATP-binding subunit [Bacteroidales bacterium]|nr:ATP-dependent Clp protease ATP-binding subunit [Bacteroidales bacterium]